MPRLNSLQWKTMLIMFLLTLLVMLVTGTYLIRELENYSITSFTADVESQTRVLSRLLTPTVARYVDSRDPRQRENIDPLIREYRPQEGKAEVIVVDVEGTVIGTSTGSSAAVGQPLRSQVVNRALYEVRSQQNEQVIDGTRMLSLTYPMISQGEEQFAQGELIGAVLVRAPMTQVEADLARFRRILAIGTLLALSIAVGLAYLLARTITGPVVDLTQRAAGMADGDFDQRIVIRSEDEIGQLAGMFNHLTARLGQTLDEMEAEKRKLEAVLTNMADGLIALNLERRVILINPAAASALDVDPGIIKGQPVTKIEAASGWEEAIDGTLGGEQPSGLVRFEHNHRIYRTHFAPITSESGEVTGVVVVLQDVTEQQRLDAMRKDFVANVSHELRTPLTGIKSYVETVLEDAIEKPDTARRFLQVVNDETDRMTRLVRDLLELSKLDYDHTEWDRQPLKMDVLVRDWTQKLSGPIQSKDLQIVIDDGVDVGLVHGDRDRIQQVFMNLLGNAVEFSEPGGEITIDVSSIDTGDPAGDAVVRTEVRDNGVGIPKEDLPRVFERFYRVDKSRNRQLGGTGLGLAIARQIVRAHGGRIDIESEPGCGTRVWFDLPVKDEATVDPGVSDSGPGEYDRGLGAESA